MNSLDYFVPDNSLNPFINVFLFGLVGGGVCLFILSFVWLCLDFFVDCHHMLKFLRIF